MKKYICQKCFLGDHFAEKETKRGPILAKGLLRRPRSPKGDLFGNTATPKIKIEVRKASIFSSLSILFNPCRVKVFSSSPKIIRNSGL